MSEEIEFTGLRPVIEAQKTLDAIRSVTITYDCRMCGFRKPVRWATYWKINNTPPASKYEGWLCAACGGWRV